MKTIFTFIFALFLILPAIGQNSTKTDENGRPLGFTPPNPPAAKVATRAPESTPKAPLIINGVQVPVDLDDPTSWEARLAAATIESFYAEEKELDVKALASRLTEMQELFDQLSLYNQQLQLENKQMRESLQTCCGGLTANWHDAAQLLQNAPNPFYEQTDILFHIPAAFRSASIQLRDVDGTIIESFPIQRQGAGKINVAGKMLSAGSYIYTLVVDGEIVDSKVMILTK